MFYIILIATTIFLLRLIFQQDTDEYTPKGSVEPEVRDPEVGRTIVSDRPAEPVRPAAGPEKQPERPADKPSGKYSSVIYELSFDETLPDESFDSEIAGLTYNCNFDDLGRIIGIVRPDPENKFDPRAQAVIRSDGKKLGFIPRSSLDSYADFNLSGRACPFAGEIIRDYEGRLIGFIHIFQPRSAAYVRQSITEFFEKN